MLLQAVVHEAGKVTCLFADELSNVLWVGHHDGKVSGHSLGDAPGTAINSQQLCCWQVGIPVPCSAPANSFILSLRTVAITP